MPAGLAAVLGLVVGVALGMRLARRRPPPPPPAPAAPQLLRWIDDAPCGWLILSPGDGVERINPRARRQLHLEAEAPVAAAATLPPPALPLELREIAQDARRRARPQRRTWEVEGDDLELFALPGEAGWVALVLLSRRSLEAQLEQQERWVSDVAHELRTPLTALRLVGETLAGQATPAQQVMVERLLRELRRLQELVRDLLELSRLENALPAETDLGTLPLEPVVRRVWADLRPLAEERRVRLLLDPPPGDTPVRVRAVDSWLHRGLLNLLDNAVSFSPEGGTVEVGIEPGPRWCRLTVRDHGPGLSEDDLEHMFERFYRGDPARARGRRGGSGLGLPIVQQIAVSLGGRITAENHPGGGAVFEWLLPLAG